MSDDCFFPVNDVMDFECNPDTFLNFSDEEAEVTLSKIPSPFAWDYAPATPSPLSSLPQEVKKFLTAKGYSQEEQEKLASLPRFLEIFELGVDFRKVREPSSPCSSPFTSSPSPLSSSDDSSGDSAAESDSSPSSYEDRLMSDSPPLSSSSVSLPFDYPKTPSPVQSPVAEALPLTPPQSSLLPLSPFPSFPRPFPSSSFPFASAPSTIPSAPSTPSSPPSTPSSSSPSSFSSPPPPPSPSSPAPSAQALMDGKREIKNFFLANISKIKAEHGKRGHPTKSQTFLQAALRFFLQPSPSSFSSLAHPSLPSSFHELIRGRKGVPPVPPFHLTSFENWKIFENKLSELVRSVYPRALSFYTSEGDFFYYLHGDEGVLVRRRTMQIYKGKNKEDGAAYMTGAIYFVVALSKKELVHCGGSPSSSSEILSLPASIGKAIFDQKPGDERVIVLKKDSKSVLDALTRLGGNRPQGDDDDDDSGDSDDFTLSKKRKSSSSSSGLDKKRPKQEGGGGSDPGRGGGTGVRKHELSVSCPEHPMKTLRIPPEFSLENSVESLQASLLQHSAGSTLVPRGKNPFSRMEVGETTDSEEEVVSEGEDSCSVFVQPAPKQQHQEGVSLGLSQALSPTKQQQQQLQEQGSSRKEVQLVDDHDPKQQFCQPLPLFVAKPQDLGQEQPQQPQQQLRSLFQAATKLQPTQQRDFVQPFQSPPDPQTGQKVQDQEGALLRSQFLVVQDTGGCPTQQSRLVQKDPDGVLRMAQALAPELERGSQLLDRQPVVLSHSGEQHQKVLQQPTQEQLRQLRGPIQGKELPLAVQEQQQSQQLQQLQPTDQGNKLQPSLQEYRYSGGTLQKQPQGFRQEGCVQQPSQESSREVGKQPPIQDRSRQQQPIQEQQPGRIAQGKAQFSIVQERQLQQLQQLRQLQQPPLPGDPEKTQLPIRDPVRSQSQSHHQLQQKQLVQPPNTDQYQQLQQRHATRDLQQQQQQQPAVQEKIQPPTQEQLQSQERKQKLVQQLLQQSIQPQEQHQQLHQQPQQQPKLHQQPFPGKDPQTRDQKQQKYQKDKKQQKEQKIQSTDFQEILQLEPVQWKRNPLLRGGVWEGKGRGGGGGGGRDTGPQDDVRDEIRDNISPVLEGEEEEDFLWAGEEVDRRDFDDSLLPSVSCSPPPPLFFALFTSLSTLFASLLVDVEGKGEVIGEESGEEKGEAIRKEIGEETGKRGEDLPLSAGGKVGKWKDRRMKGVSPCSDSSYIFFSSPFSRSSSISSLVPSSYLSFDEEICFVEKSSVRSLTRDRKESKEEGNGELDEEWANCDSIFEGNLLKLELLAYREETRERKRGGDRRCFSDMSVFYDFFGFSSVSAENLHTFWVKLNDYLLPHSPSRYNDRLLKLFVFRKQNSFLSSKQRAGICLLACAVLFPLFSPLVPSSSFSSSFSSSLALCGEKGNPLSSSLSPFSSFSPQQCGSFFLSLSRHRVLPRSFSLSSLSSFLSSFRPSRRYRFPLSISSSFPLSHHVPLLFFFCWFCMAFGKGNGKRNATVDKGEEKNLYDILSNFAV